MSKKIENVIADLSYEEIGQLQEAAAARREELREQAKADTRGQIEALLKSSGFNLAEIYPQLARNWAKGAAHGSNRNNQVPVKYVDPQNPRNKWSGRGKRPKWFSDALQAGISETDLLAK